MRRLGVVAAQLERTRRRALVVAAVTERPLRAEDGDLWTKQCVSSAGLMREQWWARP